MDYIGHSQRRGEAKCCRSTGRRGVLEELLDWAELHQLRAAQGVTVERAPVRKPIVRLADSTRALGVMIDSRGDVGIGTLAPAAALGVNGDVAIYDRFASLVFNVRSIVDKTNADSYCTAPATAIYVPRSFSGKTGDTICAADDRNEVTCAAVKYVYVTQDNSSGSYTANDRKCSDPVPNAWPWGRDSDVPDTHTGRRMEPWRYLHRVLQIRHQAADHGHPRSGVGEARVNHEPEPLQTRCRNRYAGAPLSLAHPDSRMSGMAFTGEVRQFGLETELSSRACLRRCSAPGPTRRPRRWARP